jgi:hypothetical protein
VVSLSFDPYGRSGLPGLNCPIVLSRRSFGGVLNARVGRGAFVSPAIIREWFSKRLRPRAHSGRAPFRGA